MPRSLDPVRGIAEWQISVCWGVGKEIGYKHTPAVQVRGQKTVEETVVVAGKEVD
jgi:hypothetical protein